MTGLWAARTIMMAAAAPGSGAALGQPCHQDGPVVSCDDGRRGVLSGDAVIWPDGTRSSAAPHPSVSIGDKACVLVGPGVMVGKGSGSVPVDNVAAPGKCRCAARDGVSCCN